MSKPSGPGTNPPEPPISQPGEIPRLSARQLNDKLYITPDWKPLADSTSADIHTYFTGADAIPPGVVRVVHHLSALNQTRLDVAIVIVKRAGVEYWVQTIAQDTTNARSGNGGLLHPIALRAGDTLLIGFLNYVAADAVYSNILFVDGRI